MKIGRTVPPAAAPLGWSDLVNGVAALFSPRRSLRTREEEIRRHFGVEHVFLVSSGTAALTLTMMALKSMSSNTDVVIPAYTCFAVPAAVLKAGLRPVLCDIDAATFDYDHRLLEHTLNSNTLCVVAHHLFGVPSDIDGIRSLARRRRAFVIEDAAQAMGVESDGRLLGTIGDVGIFSLGRGKHVTCGAGGIIITRSPKIAEALARQYRRVRPPAALTTLKDFLRLLLMTIFIRPHLYWVPASLPFLRLGETIFPTDIPLERLSAMKAGVLKNWKAQLTAANATRSETVGYFCRAVPLPAPQRPVRPYLRLPMLLRGRAEQERVYRSSRTLGLGLALAYPSPVSDIPEVRDASLTNRKRFPAARKVVDSLLTIPTHELLSEQDKRAIAEFCRKAAIA